MRNEYYDDHEQSEAVKKWLRDNGFSIFAGIALGMGALFGWRAWQSHEAESRLDAAAGYERLVARLDAGEEATADMVMAFLQEYDNAAFATLAAMKASQLAVEARNLEEAMELLGFAAEKGEPEQIRHVAGLRLARVQLQAGQLDRAAQTVDQHDTQGFEGLASEIRGDILLAGGDREGASQAYQFALDNLATGDRGLIEMKLNDLAVAETIEGPEATSQDTESQVGAESSAEADPSAGPAPETALAMPDSETEPDLQDASGMSMDSANAESSDTADPNDPDGGGL